MKGRKTTLIREFKKPLAILLVLLSVFIYGCGAKPVVSYRMGSSGDQVKEIQQRLKDWGYYKGAVDGDYGIETQDAVIAFQIKHKITIDGVVGNETAEKLGISLKSSSGGSSGNQGDVYLLARLVYGEARGEPYKGKVAVAAVVLNRVESSKFPNTIAKIIYQKGAFSVVDDGQINLSPDQEALKAARDAMNGWDPSGNALFYFNPSKSTNQWIRTREVICVIGEHHFCK